jgi:uncharacterized protein YigA (DUF484 family)
MSTVKQQEAAPFAINEDAIADYLQENPDFFERYGSLLNTLEIPHTTGGAAISLVERQVSVLRQRSNKLEDSLRELVEVARGNDELAAKIHVLAMALLGAKNRHAVVTILEEQLRTGFNADQSVLVLFSGDDIDYAGSFLRKTRRDDRSISPFKTFLQANTARCGAVRDAQRNFLFGMDNIEIGSVALIPLGNKSALGFLAIGSHSATHFHPGKSIDFLTRLGELVTCALKNR